MEKAKLTVAESVVEEVVLDINECIKAKLMTKAKGEKAIAYCRAHANEIAEYRSGGMKIEDISELAARLSRL